MKRVSFYKLCATGNDFIAIDNRNLVYDALNKNLWESMCYLKSGIGADGVLLLEPSSKFDFKMRYINADGGEVAMCGNGARAITYFAHTILNFGKEKYQFETKNSVYECSIDAEFGYKLKMTELYDLRAINLDDLFLAKSNCYLNTGVPHSVFEVDDVDKIDLISCGRKIRFDGRFREGTNVNFYQLSASNKIKIRTYERGVENETLSCGTGAVATAITAAIKHQLKEAIVLETKGGELAVKFDSEFKNIFLCGQVKKVFEGTFEIN